MAVYKVKLSLVFLVISTLILVAQSRPSIESINSPAIQLTYNACMKKCGECRVANVNGGSVDVVKKCEIRMCLNGKPTEGKFEKFSQFLIFILIYLLI